MKNALTNIIAFIEKNKADCYAVALLIGFSFAGFFSTRHLVPSIADEYMLLTSVSRTPNPFSYFASDWGMGTHFYRPLLSISYWVVYKFFGVSNFPNQLLSILSHTLVIVLLYRTIRLYLSHIPLAFLFSAVPLFSINTLYSAIFTPDRCMAFVGVCLLLLLGHIFVCEKKGAALNLPYVILLCAVALASKESGAVVVALALFASLKRSAPFVKSWPVFMGVMALVIFYAGLRFAIFGTDVAAYPPECYLFGIYPLADPAKYAGVMKLVPMADNFVKNVAGVFFPVYADGRFYIPLQRVPFLLLIGSLYFLTINKNLNRAQKLACFIVLINALVHWPTFRHRTLYLSQIALSVFLSASPRIASLTLVREWALKAALFFIFMLEFLWVSGQVNITGNFQTIYEENLANLKPSIEKGLIDPEIVRRVMDHYNIRKGF